MTQDVSVLFFLSSFCPVGACSYLLNVCMFLAPLHNQHNAATTPLLAAVNKASSHSSGVANRAVNKLTGNSSSSSGRAAIDGGHSPSPDFTARYAQAQKHATSCSPHT